MALTLSAAAQTAAQNGAADAVTALVDVGGAGTLELQTSGGVEVSTNTFSATAFGAASSGSCTANSITDDSSATGGTVTQFEVKNNAGTVIWGGTVAESGADLNIDDGTPGGGVVITAGQTVQITSLVFSMGYTAP